MTVASVVLARPSDDPAGLDDMVAGLSRAGSGLHEQASALRGVADAALAGWVGQAADGFAAKAAQGVAALEAAASRHERTAAALRGYRARVSEARDASVRAGSGVRGAVRTHNARAVDAVGVIDERIARLRQEASDAADQAVKALSSFNLVGAVEDGFRALSDTAQAAADQVELLAGLRARLESWAPYPLEPVLEPHPAGGALRVWDAGSVTADLEDAGGFLVSTAVGGLEQFLALADEVIADAVSRIRQAEVDVASGIAEAHRLVDDAFDRLRTEGEHAAAVVGEGIRGAEWVVGQAAVTAWHGAERGVGEAWHAAEVVVDTAVVEPAEQDWHDVTRWVKNTVEHNQGWMKDVSVVLGYVSTAAAILSLFPGVGEVMLPIAVGATLAKDADDALLVGAGDEDRGVLVSDAVDTGLFGAGEILGVAAKTASMAATETKLAMTAGDEAATAEGQAAVYERMGAEDAAAARHTDAAAARADATSHTVSARMARMHPGWAFERAGKAEVHSLVHEVQTSSEAMGRVRATGLRSYVAGSWREAMTGPGRYVYVADMGLQTAGVAHDLPDQIRTTQTLIHRAETAW